MRASMIVTGVLSLGTLLVFAFAALTATLFPNGTVVSNGGNPMMIDRGWVGGGIAIPVPEPAIELAPDVEIRGGGLVPPDAFEPLPGDIVVPDGVSGITLAPEP